MSSSAVSSQVNQHRVPGTWPFLSAIFLSAFLLFQVQLIIGKLILPWFGGTPGVWTTCLLVFQSLLLVGYTYPHLTSRLAKRVQRNLHGVLLATAVCSLAIAGWRWRAPLLPGAEWRPTGPASPVLAIVTLLLVSVGLPFFVLATTGPLLQRWHSQAFPDRSPYRLYAVSNAGSLLGLLSYPVLFERVLRLKQQGWLWAGLFAVFAALVGWCAAKWTQAAPAQQASASASGVSSRTQLLWILLAAAGSTMLLAITNVICQEIAVIAFLWVAPLVVYLISFIICFEHERWYRPGLFHTLFAVAAGLFVTFHFTSLGLRTFGQIGGFLFILFASCMVCHGELYRRRPDPQQLTLFYLHVSIGGALGGLFVAVVAPHLFRGFWELPIGFSLCAALLVGTVIWNPASWANRAPRVLSSVARIAMITALLAMAAVLWQQAQLRINRNLWMGRNFYGSVSVRRFLSPDPSEDGFVFMHGRTSHGMQLLARERRDFPTLYYGPDSGIGRLMQDFPRPTGDGLRVALVGLGIGTLAAYGQPGDVLECYEINPLVADIAEGQGGYFSMLRDSRAKISVVLGDGRLSLERQAQAGRLQAFDLMVFDTFNSDTIPVHILTKEAMETYLRHLHGPDSVIAFHISSPVDLAPVLGAVSDHFHLYAVQIQRPDEGQILRASRWVLVSRSPAVLRLPRISEVASSLPPARVPLWTDDYSNLLPLVR